MLLEVRKERRGTGSQSWPQSQRTAEASGSQTSLPIRIIWRTLKKCRCPGHTPGQLNRNRPWGFNPGAVLSKSFVQTTFLRRGSHRHHSQEEQKEASGKQAQKPEF